MAHGPHPSSHLFLHSPQAKSVVCVSVIEKSHSKVTISWCVTVILNSSISVHAKFYCLCICLHICLHIVCNCFCTTGCKLVTELSSGDRDHTAGKAWDIYWLALHRTNVPEHHGLWKTRAQAITASEIEYLMIFGDPCDAEQLLSSYFM